MIVDCAQYCRGVRQDAEKLDIETAAARAKRGDGFVWLGLHDPDVDELRRVGAAFGLHELALEDAYSKHQRPKLERYDNTLFMVFKTVRYVTNESPDTANEIVESGEIMVFLGKDFVITVRHGNHSGLSKLRHVLEEDPERLEIGPAAVMHAIADQVVDNYLHQFAPTPIPGELLPPTPVKGIAVGGVDCDPLVEPHLRRFSWETGVIQGRAEQREGCCNNRTCR